MGKDFFIWVYPIVPTTFVENTQHEPEASCSIRKQRSIQNKQTRKPNNGLSKGHGFTEIASK